ncbi:hypothetical protein M5K25_024723 [Dendrobium thyrsiflorum]|uniref:RING-type domain-containing protein n=1 Tax=Dendrobium thyrsiflorum TaxID=117978 RepID=A0ABD0U2Q4_DENTH
MDISGGGELNFSTNIVIILAVLLYALVCAPGLYSIVRCALRCRRWLSFETTEATETRLAMTRLNNCTLRKIPLSIYGSNGNKPLTECPICLVEFTDGEKVRVLPSCNHSFHVQCIDTWLSFHSSCPICRHSLLDRSEVPTCIVVGERMSKVDGSPSVAAAVDEVT